MKEAMYDVIYIDSHGDETPLAQHMTDRKDAAEVAKHEAAERGVGRMVLPGSLEAAQLRLRRARRFPKPRSSRSATASVPVHADRGDRRRSDGLGHRGGVRARGRRRHGRGGRRAAAEQARARIEKSLDRGARSGKLSGEDRDGGRRAARLLTRLDDLEGADAAIEAIVENETAKRELFQRLDARPARRRVPGLQHLLGADHEARRRHVEAGARARPALLQPRAGAPARRGRALDHDRRRGARARARSFAQDTLGKVCIDSQDRAGFVVNALLIPYLLSAIRMYESGFASKEDIDEGMIKGCAHPMGPLALADLIGLDTLLAVSESLYDEFRDPASVAPALLNRMVEAGLLGRKSGRGFYDYSK